MIFNKRPVQQRPPQRMNLPQKNCEIKIKNTKGGRSIRFEGNCSKEEKIEMLRGLNSNGNFQDDER